MTNDPVTGTSGLLDPLALFRLDGKVAIVTGASSGLGDRFARVLHAVGARVVLVARRAACRAACLPASASRSRPTSPFTSSPPGSIGR